jgi:hypothetical protein
MPDETGQGQDDDAPAPAVREELEWQGKPVGFPVPSEADDVTHAAIGSTDPASERPPPGPPPPASTP